MDLKDIVNKNKEELLENLKKLVSFNSVSVETEGQMHFGEECAKCLEEALKIAEGYGFTTKNLDNYCGYAEIGSGDDIIGIAGHLDIVPAGEGWNTDPFCLTIKDDTVYGRGVADDKGAVVASMLAMKIIKELNIPLNKRIRLIMGCAEETGSKCMEYYNEKEGPFTIGFTPDSTFPCVHGEKGYIRAKFESKNTSIIDIKGGTVGNAVCESCTIKIKSGSFDRVTLENFLSQNEIEFEINEQDDITTIKVKGRAAHASTPEYGKSAIMYLMEGLKQSKYEDEFVKYYCDRFNFESDGNGFNIKCEDKYGKLTLVNGTIEMENGSIVGGIDIRVPVTLNTADIARKLGSTQDERAIVEVVMVANSIFFEPDSKFVQKLVKAYQDVTGDKENLPITSGGGTYAKELKNCIAFGCAFPNKNNKIHESNEFVEINELLMQTQIYANAILELLKD